MGRVNTISAILRRPWLPALALFVLAAHVPTAAAASRDVRVRFRPSVSAGVVHYRIHVGVRPGTFDRVMDIPFALDPSGVASGVVGGLDELVTYYLTLSAVDGRGRESRLSNELQVPAATCAVGACDDRNPCTVDACSNGACGHARLANGTRCNDGDPATLGDACLSGRCLGQLAPASPSTPAPVPAPPSQRRSARLRFRPSPDRDVVRYRVLVGRAPRVYDQRVDVPIALDAQGIASATLTGLDGAQRFVALVAVDARGLESVPSNELILPAALCATRCDDGNPCTLDSCAAGVCRNSVAANGTVCTDGDARTQNDVCLAGTCRGTLPPVGPAPTPTPTPLPRSARLRFRPSPDADVVRYRVLIGVASRRYDRTVEVQSFALDPQGVATTTLMGLDAAQRFVAIVAVDRRGNVSAPSNELVVPAAPAR